jgi:hypothetical protein
VVRPFCCYIVTNGLSRLRLDWDAGAKPIRANLVLGAARYGVILEGDEQFP